MERGPGSFRPIAAVGNSRDVSKWSQYGLPGGDSHYLFRENFVVCYDSRTRNAKWVLEKVTAETVSKGAERTNIDFYEDAGVEERFRNRLRYEV